MKGKHTILLCAGIAVVLSCTSYEELRYPGRKESLIVNGILRTDDTLHAITVTYGTAKGGVYRRGHDATVKCFVNGEFVSEGEKVEYENEGELLIIYDYDISEINGLSVVASDPNTDNYYTDTLLAEYRKYTFKADIHPGDKVRIEVSSDMGKASVDAVAPQPCRLELVDTTAIRVGRGAFDDPRDYNIRIKIHDIPGEETWFVPFKANGLMETCDGPDGETIRSGIVNKIAWFDTDNPVYGHETLDIPNELARNIGAPQDLGYSWSFTFSDHSFEDGSMELEYRDVRQRDIMVTGAVDHHYDELRLRQTALLPVGTINKTTYQYAQDLDIYRSASAEAEPVIFPDNVEGGIGYVGIITVTTLPVRLDDYVVWYDVYY